MSLKMVLQRNPGIYAVPVYENGWRTAELVLIAVDSDDALQQGKRLLKQEFFLWYVTPRKLENASDLFDGLEIEEAK